VTLHDATRRDATLRLKTSELPGRVMDVPNC